MSTIQSLMVFEIFRIFGDYIVDYFDAIDFVKKLES